MFVCLLIMVGEKLSLLLRKRHQDLTEEMQLRTRLQTEIAAALDGQLRIREERQRFIHILGHEIGTPLAVIDRSAEMIQDKPDSIPQRIPVIRTAVRRLSLLTQDLFVAERYCLEVPKRQAFDANQLLREAIDLVEASAPAVAVRVQSAQQALPLYGDPEMLKLALTNVLNNAIKFSTAEQQQPVLLSLVTDTDWVTILVEDSGIGFLETELHRAKRQFFRGSNALAHPGNGLGLYIVDQIIKNHGGWTEISNRKGGGAAVALHLPAMGENGDKQRTTHSGS
ncbi:MAG: HAMP domain-containing histidine kinase [Magnetococcales bacterium]|nr:HAMP domain-containing histidine kinase [Magnetococcales bacterium]MBF0115042.1 HAMP domain-containing histidine kinase [Magnetococcales bacterium]